MTTALGDLARTLRQCAPASLEQIYSLYADNTTPDKLDAFRAVYGRFHGGLMAD